MPGKTPQLALDNYLHPLRQSLACVTNRVFAYTPAREGVELPLGLADAYTPVFSAMEEFGLFFNQSFIIQKSGRGFKVLTRSYYYGLLDAEQNEIIQYHWHPGNGNNVPHLHIACAGVARPEFHGAHLPCGRIAFEDFLLFLISEFGIQAVGGYQHILDTNRQKFRDHCSWYWESE